MGHNIYALPTVDQILDVDARAYLNTLTPRPDAIIPRIGVALSGFGHSLITMFEHAGIFTLTSSYGLLHSRDKLLAGQIMQSSGLQVPKTISFARPGHVDKAIRAVGGYPFILKKLKGTQGQDVYLINDVDEAHGRIGNFIYEREPFLIQEYIKESQGADLRCFVVGNKVVGAMKRVAAKGDFRANIHAGATAQGISLSAAEKKAAILAAKSLKLDVAGVDILQSARGPLILEVNSSPGLGGIEHATGLDIAAEIVTHITRRVSVTCQDSTADNG